MPKSGNIEYIVIHCSAGFGLIPAIENYWYKTLKWKSAGYHIIIYPDGTRWYITKDNTYSTDIKLWFPEKVTNGVLGWNDKCLHVCYIGGVEKVNNKWIAKDTRTEEQKAGIIYSIIECFNWLQEEGIDTATNTINIVGHRDFSDDKNGNGVIESWERIKECPSFEAIPCYEWITLSKTNPKVKLPYYRKNIRNRK